jgi:hypothetical protein
MRPILPVAIMLVSAPMLLAYVEGPLPGRTGGFGEPTCRACHFDNRLDDPPGTLRLSGVPRSYTPNTAYTITITLARPDLRRGGFELSSRFASGPKAGRQAGTLRPLDRRVQLVSSTDGALQYAQHSQPGTVTTTPGRIQWSVGWIAPARAEGPVVFHAAGNATNDDASALGDYIYLTEARSLEPK